MIKDTSYALIRRLSFIEDALREHAAKRGSSQIAVADIGCGTGELLTIPLAVNLGSTAEIFAFEPESKSFSHLRHQIQHLNINTVHPVKELDVLHMQTYDAVIISEVIEHVQDPVNFLRGFRKLLKESGIVLITTPNGYGIFELETMLFYTLELIGVIPFLRGLKRKLRRSRGIAVQPDRADTLAVSPHINFFSLGELYHILTEAGLSCKKIEGRNFAAGPFSDKIIDKSGRLIKWNSSLGKVLPLRLATDWMLIAEFSALTSSKTKTVYSPVKLNLLQKLYTRYKRWLNLYLSRRR